MDRPQVNISKTYNSERCRLVSIVWNGKKQTPAILHLKGLPTALGDGISVRALEGGVVLHAGRNYDKTSRLSQRGVYVTIRGRDGVNVSYERLATALVREGDLVRAGEVIGYEGSSGTGSAEYLAIRFERNGRLVNGLDYLGISGKLGEYRNKTESAEEIVCRVCNLDQHERYSIRGLPCANSIWDKFLSALEKRWK